MSGLQGKGCEIGGNGRVNRRGDFSRPRTSIKGMPVINARVGD